MSAVVEIPSDRLVGEIRRTDGTLVRFVPDDGTAGVREPRRPRPTAPTLARVERP